MTDLAGRSAHTLLARVLSELSIDAPPPAFPRGFTTVPLSSRLDIGSLAWASVTAATLTAHLDAARVDRNRVAVAYRSDRVLTIDGAAPAVWSALSGFWRTSDGWIRTHGNYPHHARGLRDALRLDESASVEAIARTLEACPSAEAVDAISAAGGLAVRVRRERPPVDASLRRSPLVEMQALGPSASPRTARQVHSSAPLAGVRVLDLTRVIAGPVCTRTLAVLGADVLRIDPPHLAEPEWQHFDTGHGKRSARLDARSPAMDELLACADVVVLGYRPAALARLGLDPQTLHRRHPSLVIGQLSAWGSDHPERAGFDSLVQAESGIAMVESPDGDRPGVLPAQALDHSAGYLLAAAITRAIQRRSDEGNGWLVHTSLRRIAAELLGMPRRTDPVQTIAFDPTAHVERFDVDGIAVTTAASALPGTRFAPPHRWGSDQPRWSD